MEGAEDKHEYDTKDKTKSKGGKESEGMKEEEKKEIEQTLIKIASLHNPEVPLDLIKRHVAQHIDILDKHIDKYGVITHNSIKGLHEALLMPPRLRPPMPTPLEENRERVR